MKRLQWIIVLVALFLVTAGATGVDVERYEGVARSDSGALLYRETHEVTRQGDRPVKALTIYRDASGAEIGRLLSDFSRSAYAPSYRFVDQRAQRRESVAVSGQNLTMSFNGERKTLAVPSDDVLVAGQGLHHYIRLNLPELAKSSANVRFAIPSRLDIYGFRVRPIGNPAPGVVRLRVEIDSVVLRLVAPHLEVDYEVATRRLLRYRGVSNLEAPDGSAQDATITYAY